MFGFSSTTDILNLSPIIGLRSDITVFRASMSLEVGSPLTFILISVCHFLMTASVFPYSLPSPISVKYSISLSVYLEKVFSFWAGVELLLYMQHSVKRNIVRNNDRINPAFITLFTKE